MLLPFYLYIAISTSEGVATTQTLDVEASSFEAFLNGLETETVMIYEDERPLLFAEIEQLPVHKFSVRTKEGMFFVHRELNDVSGRCYKVHRFNTVLGLM